MHKVESKEVGDKRPSNYSSVVLFPRKKKSIRPVSLSLFDILCAQSNDPDSREEEEEGVTGFILFTDILSRFIIHSAIAATTVPDRQTAKTTTSAPLKSIIKKVKDSSADDDTLENKTETSANDQQVPKPETTK